MIELCFINKPASNYEYLPQEIMIALGMNLGTCADMTFTKARYMLIPSTAIQEKVASRK